MLEPGGEGGVSVGFFLVKFWGDWEGRGVVGEKRTGDELGGWCVSSTQ